MKAFKTMIMVLALAIPAASSAQFAMGEVVPDFTLPDLQGNMVNLHSHLGHIVVLNFFTTWCPGCNEEAAHLENDIRLAYMDQGVDVVAISLQEHASLVQGWAAAQDVHYQILLADDWDLFQEFPSALSIPYNAVLAPDMTLRYALPGFDLEAITTVIEEILGEGQVSDQNHTFGYIKSTFKK